MMSIVTWRRLRTALLLGVLVLPCAGCQFLQNEFFFLDRAQPETPVDVEHPW